MEKRSSSVFRIDEKVFYLMGLMVIICLVVLGFRYKNHEVCEQITIETSSANYYAKSLITFKAKSATAKRYEWYFGDNTKPETGTESSITHEFKNPGLYTITVIVNDQCEQVINVDIKEEPFTAKAVELVPQISGSDTAYIDRPITFKEINPDASSWEWHIDNNKIQESNSQEATYTFDTDGFHTVSVRINGRFVGLKDVYVKDPKPFREDAITGTPSKKGGVPPIVLPHIQDRPTTQPNDVPPKVEIKPKEEVKVVRDITPDEISVLLEGVVSGKKDAVDFTEFLCGDLNIMVKYNDKSMSFNRMCNELKEFKKAKKISKPDVTLAKDKATNCIKSMNVKVDKKSWFQRIVD